jgi:hypothetical protein
MLNTKRITAVLILALGLLAPTICAQRKPVANGRMPECSVRHEGTNVYLIRGTKRLLVVGRPESIVQLDRKYTLHVVQAQWNSEVAALGGGKVVAKADMKALEDRWLDDESIWGDHKIANEMRYMHRSAGGLSPFLTNFISQGDSVLAVLSWRANGPSIMPIIAQHLVRIRIRPNLSVEPIRLLDYDVQSKSSWPLGVGVLGSTWLATPRLFRFQGKLLLHTKPGRAWDERGGQPPAEMVTIAESGKLGRAITKLPAQYYPVGLVNGRWLLLGWPNEKASEPLKVLDLKTKKLSVLPGPWRGYSNPQQVIVPESGNRVLVQVAEEREGEPGAVHTAIVRVPEGKRIDVSTKGYIRALWEGVAVTVDDPNVHLYSVSTGKLLQGLSLSRR